MALQPIRIPLVRTSHIHLPAALRSTGITRLRHYYDCSDFCTTLNHRTDLPASRLWPSNHSVSKIPMLSLSRFNTLPISAERLPKGSRLRQWLAGSPEHQAETSSSSYPGAPGAVHLRLLPTPPHDDAVTFDYGPENAYPKGTHTPQTKHAHRRTNLRVPPGGIQRHQRNTARQTSRFSLTAIATIT